MSEENNTVESKVETVDVDIDAIFGATTDSVVVPEEKKPNVMSRPSTEVDMNFTEPTKNTETIDNTNDSETPEAEKGGEEPTASETQVKAEGNDIIDTFTEIDEELDETEEVKSETKKTETRGRKKIEGISDVFNSLIKKEKVFAFEDDKGFEEYSAKDWEELIEANIEEAKNQVRRETPKQFFEALPNELKVAARYVADGGTDLKGLFRTLAQAEETYDLDVSTTKGQEDIIMQYLSATGYGTQEEINEEIEIWKDLGKLEQQASKFKPKLDKMQEKVVAQKLQEQEMKQKQQEKASKQYMHNVYETLKGGAIGDLKLDKRTQSLLYNGLVQPAYPSVSGKNTNLLGHLLEKYQFQEPNYQLISEALWLLADPKGYKSKIMEKGAKASVEKTVRKLKTEQANRSGASMGVQETETKRTAPAKKKLKRTNNFFKRI